MAKLIAPPQPPSGGGTASSAASTPAAPAMSGVGSSFDITDLKQYLHIIVKRVWLVALCFVIALVVTVIMLMRQVPLYRAVTTLLLSEGLPLPKQLERGEMDLVKGADYIKTQQRIMTSGLIHARARERMNRPAQVISQSIKQVSVQPVGQTAFMSITVNSLNPIIGAEYANAMAEAYLDFKAEERLDTSQATVISLTQQANRLYDEVRKAEERVLAFRKENNMVGIGARGSIAERTMGDLANQSAGFRTRRLLLEHQQPLLSDAPADVVLSALDSGFAPVQLAGARSAAGLDPDNPSAPSRATSRRGPESLIEHGVVERPRWEDLKRDKATYESELAVLRMKFRDAHPEVMIKQRAIAEVEQMLNVELQFAMREFYSNLEALSIREEAARRAELEWQDEAMEMSRKSLEYRNLQRDVGRLQKLYDLMFDRLKEVDISIGIEPESIRIMEEARPAGSPVTPRKLQSLFISALIGLGIGLGLVFGLEFIDDSLRYPEEVTQGLGLNFFGVIPAAQWDPEDLRTHVLSNIDQKSGLAEAYRNIRSGLMYALEGNQHTTLAITSAVPREGKTTTALNIAVSLSQAGKRVLLVDADMRRGGLHKFFGLEAGRGLSDILVGEAKAESVVQRTGLPSLDLIATGPFPPNPAEIVLRPEFENFVKYARRTYDLILFDCPPVMAVSEAGILASSADSVMFVVWAGQTSRKLSQMAVQVLQGRGAHMIGCVLNNLEFGRVGYYYYSTYYGYYDYHYRYDRPEPGAARG